MKKYLIAMFATATVSLAGCGMSQDQMMMMEEQMMMMEEMSAQMSEMQFQVNTNAAAADKAKQMAQDAMVKASMMNGMNKMPDSSMDMMHKQKMMK